jgi:hypothetical protein
MSGSKFGAVCLWNDYRGPIAEIIYMWKWMHYADMKIINPLHRWVFWSRIKGAERLAL